MMARVVQEEIYAARRNDILDSAQRLVYTKGYEQMTIRDILDDLQISKGAFYHYFDSKGAVLEALVERMVVLDVVPLLSSIVVDPGLSAIEKIHQYFDLGLRWKTAQKTFMLELLKVWVSDENAIVRQKMQEMTIKQVIPLLTKIIRQGVSEGVFTTAYPDQVSHVIIYILQGLSDTLIDLLLSTDTERDGRHVESTMAAFAAALGDATERVLGAPAGSLQLVNIHVLKEWF
jgi:AcrR family transcriptional regulator